MKEQYIKETLTSHLNKRDFMGKMIQEHLPLAKTVKPAGAYYYFVDLRDYLTKVNRTEEEFAEQLLRSRSVAVVPGRFFGNNGIGHVRMTFVSETEERIKRGLEKINQFSTLFRSHSCSSAFILHEYLPNLGYSHILNLIYFRL